ncbi:hypothetical protein ARTHRO9AX_10228 [Arthrobacter sp. 9AX]|nr:hypothetical protein ARTHRO9AX_10228 [Arthrobacter sp. 9AX]
MKSFVSAFWPHLNLSDAVRVSSRGKRAYTKLSVGQFFPILIGWAHL